ncbi:MAG TPA: acyl-CoA desaturase [Tepidisphaeraceae bacterium]|nr:acyl-CoA desaturase [Tepidisphaeraceae bacterium]
MTSLSVPHTTVLPAPASESNSARKLKFGGSDAFVRELRKRVDAYFTRTGRARRDCPKMYFKTATILAWFFGAYLLLLLVATAWWAVIPLAIILGVAIAAIGFNIQHDGGHKAYSESRWVNRIMSLTLDMMGGSSYLWDWKHNSFHHTYPNVSGHDDDINIGMLGRLSPEQPRFWWHRLQGIYLWVLYGFLAVKWHLFDDFYQISVGRIGGHKIPRPKGRDLLIFVGGKVVFFSIAFVVPMLLHPWWAVLSVYALAAFVSGVILSVVFQLAHCVEAADFPVPEVNADGAAKITTDWAVHQIQTTVNFSRGNRVLGWFLGGLNYQIEHHLFHKICHVHYPELSKVVEEACREFGVRYSVHRSFVSAVASHFRWLVRMGQPIAE